MNDVKKHDNKKKTLLIVVEEDTFPVDVGWGLTSATPSSTSEEASLATATSPSFAGGGTAACGLGRLGVAFAVIKASSN
jgi:hypothetical protein